ncbi:unnamed protein product [Macrosiphum euphorbiae]|uniref:BED-type domain-containing protein n=1 Tax=Macrosiphum euphorbiae TaxID=13131 RepID=A0AAV0XQC4_9HEMI|nr:unnamed protein product [Macrosiphum euphorbiae]
MIGGSDRRSLSTIILNISSPLILNGDSDSDREPGARRPVRMTCVEWQALAQDIPIIKYCPMCTYTTSGSKLDRHILNKHKALIKKPCKENVTAISKKIVAESRRSYTLVGHQGEDGAVLGRQVFQERCT